MAALGSLQAMRMESAHAEPAFDDDEPFIETKIGDVPFTVFYEVDRRGNCHLMRMEDKDGNDFPIYSLMPHAVARIRRECEKEQS